ncbi:MULTISPECIES: NADPH-dependent F420 reductase [unclassified Streptomyces]|uniref:NADPH-dependent F420 reductase n=1 Tax=unclassified Streptomyces TaxID=2593676 RepID=UPI0037F574A1
MTKTLGFIGTGMIGSALARLAVAGGLDVVLSNADGPESLTELVAELGERARAATVVEAAEAGDVVVATIPLSAHDQLPAAALAGKIVIDTMNYYPQRDGRVAVLDAQELTSSELVQRHLAGSRVVKACNTIDFRRLFTLARPSGADDRSGMAIAGDDPAAKAEVARLLDLMGYDAVDIGTLADSWRSEPETPVYVQPYFPAQPPAGITQEEAYRWHFETPGAVVPAGRVEELVGSAVRGPAGGHVSAEASALRKDDNQEWSA